MGKLSQETPPPREGEPMGVHVDLIRERKQGDSKVVMCTGCKWFFGRRRICKRKKYHCSHYANFQAGTLNFSREPVAMATSEEFQYEAFNRFREDDAGSLCRKVILLIGQRARVIKSAKKERCVIMSEMRSRANLILQMHIVVSQTFQGEDVLDRRNFDTLTGAIQNLCKKEKSSEEKSGLKLALGCTLKKTIRVMKGYYTQINDTDSH